ncbi:hypothetical protein AAC387_Pa11g1132 [Persea americana]
MLNITIQPTSLSSCQPILVVTSFTLPLPSNPDCHDTSHGSTHAILHDDTPNDSTESTPGPILNLAVDPCVALLTFWSYMDCRDHFPFTYPPVASNDSSCTSPGLGVLDSHLDQSADTKHMTHNPSSAFVTPSPVGTTLSGTAVDPHGSQHRIPSKINNPDNWLNLPDHLDEATLLGTGLLQNIVNGHSSLHPGQNPNLRN